MDEWKEARMGLWRLVSYNWWNCSFQQLNHWASVISCMGGWGKSPTCCDTVCTFTSCQKNYWRATPWQRYLFPPPGWLAAWPGKSSSRRRQQHLCFDSGCTSGLFPVAAWTQDASRSGGAAGEVKKEIKRKEKQEGVTPVSSCIVLWVLSNSGRNLPQVSIKGQDSEKHQPSGEPRCFVFHWTQWRIALLDHNGHKGPLDVWGY